VAWRLARAARRRPQAAPSAQLEKTALRLGCYLVLCHSATRSVGYGTVVFWPSLFAYGIVFVWFILDHLGSYANVTVDVFRHLVKYAHLLTNAWQWLALSLVSVCALLCKTASSSVKMVGEKFKVTGEK